MNKKTAGISVIICSRDPALCENVKSCIAETIGVEFEIIAFDNRAVNWGICKVYNHCAETAVYPYLCFIHEDINITTNGWGAALIKFAEETPNCGAIGIAGGTTAYRNFMSWCDSIANNDARFRYWDAHCGGSGSQTAPVLKSYNPDNARFTKAVTLDGCFLFAAKDICAKKPFDEDTFPGFHFYDADFTFKIAQVKQNYVCCQIDLYHFSRGILNGEYFRDVKKFQIKWKDKLPVTVENKKISAKRELHLAGAYIVACLRTDAFGCFESVSHSIKLNGYLFFVKSVFHSCIYQIFKKLGFMKTV